MDTVDALIGERVRNRMWRGRVTQVTVAEALGLDPAAVNRRMRGRTAWKVSEIYKLARLFGIRPLDLMPEMRELGQLETVTSGDAVSESRCAQPRPDRTRSWRRGPLRRVTRGTRAA